MDSSATQHTGELTKRPSIGVAMIVRDAAATVERALQSVRGVVDQCVVVDTGSVDTTPILVSRSGAELHFKRWEKSFSAARNYALALMRTDWVLVLDADEQLDASTLASALETLNDAQVGGLQVRIINALSEHDGTHSEHRYTRLFRNRPDIRFSGAIHEQIAESVEKTGLHTALSDITIYHDGYRSISEQKTARNAELLQSELEQHPHDLWTQYHLGLTEFSAGHLPESYQLLHPLIHSDALSAEQQEMARIRCAQIALAQDDLLGVETLLAFVSHDSAREGLRQYVLGAAYCGKQNFAEALRCFTEAKHTQSSLVDQTFLSTSVQQLSAYLRR